MGADALADPRAQTAHDALLVFSRKAVQIGAIALGQFLQNLRAVAAGGEQLDQHLAVLPQLRGVGVDFGIPPQGVVAGGHEARAPAFGQLHGAHPAHGRRLKRRNMAEGGDVHTVAAGHFDDGLAPLGRNLFSVHDDLHAWYPSGLRVPPHPAAGHMIRMLSNLQLR